MVFLGCRACSDFASKMHVVLLDSHADHTNINFETFTKMQPFQRDQSFVIMLPTKHNSDQMPTSCLLIHTPNSPLPTLPITLTSLFPKPLPCYQRIFTRRTRGHYLGTFSTVNFSHSHPLPMVGIVPVSHCTLSSVFSSLLSLSSLKG